MKLIALFLALAALCVVAAPSSAVAGRAAGGRGVVVVQGRSIVVARPFVAPIFVHPGFVHPIFVHPQFLSRPVVVARPLFPQGPFIVQQVAVPRSTFFFTTPGAVVVVR